MRLFALPLCLLAAACASTAGEWPSLAHRPGEAVPESPCGDGTAATPAKPPEASPPPAELPAASVTIDINERERRLADARTAWAAQRDRAETAVAAAQGASAGDTVWASAQLELSRLEQRGAEFRDIADSLSGVVTPAERSGALRTAAAEAYDEHVRIFDSLRNRLGS